MLASEIIIDLIFEPVVNIRIILLTNELLSVKVYIKISIIIQNTDLASAVIVLASRIIGSPTETHVTQFYRYIFLHLLFCSNFASNITTSKSHT
jgi:hypothetical protein